MKKCAIVGAVVLASLGLGACGRQSGRSRQQTRDIAFGQTGQTERPRVWYFARSHGQPNAQTPLRAIVVTQKGRARAYRVPKSVTLGAAAKLSTSQLKQTGVAWAKQDFTQQRRALIKTAQAELTAERQNLKRNQNATVVSFATIKTDRRVIANIQRRLGRLQRTQFKQPSSQPFAVTVKQRGRQETLHVAVDSLVKSSSDPQVGAYRQMTQPIAPVPYSRVSEQAIQIGSVKLGYYRGPHAGASEYALTRVERPGDQVKLDTTSVK
ncbi:hypothetical protein [Levilactobacillus angrenensis]|uniref:Lipoprotein n=1 Tax=Levilactobacillus angrenensis TaxID=2486020 RepID=A0ABW1UBX4_9LACO|nr:hypothetical protein [Levilactobacillus angrenensis]